MIKFHILAIALFIIGIQIMQKRLLTSVTVWVGCYCCYFIIAPLLLNNNNTTVDSFAIIGIVSFLTGYILVSLIKLIFPHVNNKHVRIEKEQLSTKRYRTVCDYTLFFTIVFLMLALGKNGLLSFLNGQLAAKNYLIKKDGIFIKLYSFMNNLVGYMILFLYIKNNGRMDKKLIVRIFIYAIVIIFFSFTRATVILLLAAIFLYKLRKEKVLRQVYIMGILVVFGVVVMILMGYVRIYGIQGLRGVNVERMVNDLVGSIDFTIPYMDFQREIEQDVHISLLVYMKPLFMIIPRIVWKGKPLASTVQILNCIDPGAMAREYSTGFTILGEGYAVLGQKGICILPFLWSVICTIFDEIYIRKIKNGTDNDLMTCSYVIFMAYIVVQSHRQGTDAVMVYFIIAVLWLIFSSKIKLHQIKLGFKNTMKGRCCNEK